MNVLQEPDGKRGRQWLHSSAHSGSAPPRLRISAVPGCRRAAAQPAVGGEKPGEKQTPIGTDGGSYKCHRWESTSTSTPFPLTALYRGTTTGPLRTVLSPTMYTERSGCCFYFFFNVTFYLYIELPTKCKDPVSGIGFHLILPYFCTAYTSTVTSQHRSKYSDEEQSGRAAPHSSGTRSRRAAAPPPCLGAGGGAGAAGRQSGAARGAMVGMGLRYSAGHSAESCARRETAGEAQSVLDSALHRCGYRQTPCNPQLFLHILFLWVKRSEEKQTVHFFA